VFTGGALTGGVSTGGVSTGGVSTGAVTGGGGLVAASIPPVAPGMALVAPAAVSEVSDGVVDVTPVAAVEGVVAEALGQTTAKAAPSAASRVASQRRPKRWLSRGLNTTGKLPPQIARTLSVLAPITTHLSPAGTHTKRGYLICPAWGPRDYHVSGTDFRTGAMGWSQLHGSASR
jgi:hypothetical protein